jgi:hypothetical protein
MWGLKLLFLMDSSQMQASVHVDCKCTQKLVEHFRPPLAFGSKIISRSEGGSLDGGSEGFWKASATLCYSFNFPNKHLLHLFLINLFLIIFVNSYIKNSAWAAS